MWDTLAFIVPPVSGAVTFAGFIGVVSMLVRWRARWRFEQQVQQRYAEQVQPLHSSLADEPQPVKWTCRRCKHRHFGLRPMGPVCRDCWHALDAYLQEVA